MNTLKVWKDEIYYKNGCWLSVLTNSPDREFLYTEGDGYLIRHIPEYGAPSSQKITNLEAASWCVRNGTPLPENLVHYKGRVSVAV